MNACATPTSAVARGTPITRFGLVTLVFALAFVVLPGQALATTLFWEDFNGYTHFPNEIPDNDPINVGLPLQSEGADEYWYGARFQTPEGGSIDSDLGVQKFGGGTNSTPVGRFEDDAGILFNISTLGYTSVTLTYDWRTFSAATGDNVRAGYYVGDLDFEGDRYQDFRADFGNGWWDAEWTQVSIGSGNSWHHVETALPVGQPSIWVAFWLDNGEGDYGKLDNVHVQGTAVIPEPSSMLLAGIGALSCLGAVYRRRTVENRARR